MTVRVMMKDGLVSLGVGVASGIVAGILLAPKNRSDNESQSSLSADLADAVVDAAQVGRDAVQTLLRRTGSAGGEGMLPDERLTLQIRDELEGLSLWNSRVDVTTVDGTVYLRGRDSNAQRADAVVHTIKGLEGVQDVVDEIRRE